MHRIDSRTRLEGQAYLGRGPIGEHDQSRQRVAPQQYVGHRLDAGDIFSGHLCRIPGAFLQNGAAQRDCAAADRYPICAGPVLGGELRLDRLADALVVPIALGRRQGLHQRPHQVGTRDDTDDFSFLHGRQPLDMVLQHEVNRVLQRRAGLDGARASGHDLADLAAMGMDIGVGLPRAAFQEAHQPREMRLGADLRAPQEIALADHTEQIAGRRHYGQAADPVPEHEPRRICDRGRRIDADHRRRHDILYEHGALSWDPGAPAAAGLLSSAWTSRPAMP